MDKYIYLYPWSLEEAKKHGQVDMWRESHKENCSCARAIEEAIKNGYHDNHLDDNLVQPIIEQYGYDRVNHVLANTIKEYSTDGRFSQTNKEWAKGFYIPKSDQNWHMAVSSHPGLTDIFINEARKAWNDLGLFDYNHCLDGLQNFQNKVVVVKGFYLNDEYKQSDYQLMYADGGNGCNPQARGSTVFGFFLKDNERCSFDRSQIYGVLKDEYLPEWAIVKLKEMQNGSEDIEAHNPFETLLRELDADEVEVMCAKHLLWHNGEGGEQANFSNCLIKDVNLTNKKLLSAVFDGARFENVQFNGASLCYSSFEGTSFIDCNLTKASAEECSFRGAKFIRTDLNWIALNHSNLTNAQFTECGFQNALLHSCCIEGAAFGSLNQGTLYLEDACDNEQDWLTEACEVKMGGVQ